MSHSVLALRVVAAVCLATAVAAPASADFPFELQLVVVDALTGNSVPLRAARILTGQRFLQCEATFGSTLVCQGELSPTERLDLRVDSPDGHRPRAVPFQVSRWEERLRLAAAISLAPEATKPSFQSLGRVVSYLKSTQTLDHALSLAETYYQSAVVVEAIELRAAIHYNYAAALLNACRVLHYDTCNEAKTKFSELREWRRREPETFASFQSRIDERMLSRALDDLETYLLQRQVSELLSLYERATAAFNRRGEGVCEAAVLYERIANGYEQKRATWTSNGLWDWKILFDLSTSRLRCAVESRRRERFSREQACEQFAASLSLLDQVLESASRDTGTEIDRVAERSRVSVQAINDRNYAKTLWNDLACGRPATEVPPAADGGMP